ncbi:MAG: hypothetical protein AAGK37_16170 [Pseudomonadota bacterium]
MKPTVCALVAASMLAGCQSGTSSAPPAQTGATPISTAAAFNSEIVGKTLTIGESSLVIASNGTMSGTFNNAPLRGTWQFRDGQFCRTLTQHSTRAPTNDCQTFVLDGEGGVMISGASGRSFTYAIS